MLCSDELTQQLLRLSVGKSGPQAGDGRSIREVLCNFYSEMMKISENMLLKG